MARETFIVVHPDGTYQQRTTVTGRVYTAAIVYVESVADKIADYERVLEDIETGASPVSKSSPTYVSMYTARLREQINDLRRRQARGVRYLYDKAMFRSDPEAARAEASRYNAKGNGIGQFDVYVVHHAPKGTNTSVLAAEIAEQWAVPF